VTSPEAVQAMVARAVDEMGQIDVVVNNAFRSYSFDPEQRKIFDELAWSDYQSQFDAAVGAAYHVCKAVLPHFRRRAQGNIVNIVTNLVEHPLVPYHDYTTAKSALVGFSRNLASELGPLGVRVNCVAPGLLIPDVVIYTTLAYFASGTDASTRWSASPRAQAPARARAVGPARSGGIGRQSVPGAASCATPTPSPILLTRTCGRSDVCRTSIATGARRHPVLPTSPSRTHLVVSHGPGALRELAGARGRVRRDGTAGLCRASVSPLSVPDPGSIALIRE
jgi:NAD(P)-dependent dehydrogenase (short-subunit alcohol dehydrogenase family)